MKHLRDGRHGRFATAAGDALFDSDGRGYTANQVHFRLAKGGEKLAHIGGEALHITPLPLGKHDVERQGRFTRTTEAGHNDKLIAWNADIDIFEIMVSCPINRDAVVIGLRYHSR